MKTYIVRMYNTRTADAYNTLLSPPRKYPPSVMTDHSAKLRLKCFLFKLATLLVGSSGADIVSSSKALTSTSCRAPGQWSLTKSLLVIVTRHMTAIMISCHINMTFAKVCNAVICSIVQFSQLELQAVILSAYSNGMIGFSSVHNLP